MSRLIKIFTGGAVSHAALCVAPTLLFEALRDGLYTTPLTFACFADEKGEQRFGAHLPNIAGANLLRHPDISADLAARGAAYYALQDDLADIASLYFARPYSESARLLAAAQNPLKYLGVWLESRSEGSLAKKDRGVFCSELVAAIYATYGIDLFAKSRKPFTVSPASLEKHSNLKPVPGAIVRGVRRKCSENEKRMSEEGLEHLESRTVQAERTRSLQRSWAENEKVISRFSSGR